MQIEPARSVSRTLQFCCVGHILHVDNKLGDMKQELHHFSTAVVTPLPTSSSARFFGNPLKSLKNGHDSSRVLHCKMLT